MNSWFLYSRKLDVIGNMEYEEFNQRKRQLEQYLEEGESSSILDVLSDLQWALLDCGEDYELH